MGQIHVVRHGQANLLGKDYDQLSEIGLEQARRTGRALKERGVLPVVIASGRLKRQVNTANAAADAAGWTAPIEVDPDLNEYGHADLFTTLYPHLPDHESISAHIAQTDSPTRAYQDLFGPAFSAWVGGATGATGLSWIAFRNRSMAAIERISARCRRGESAVVVTSGGVMAAVAQTLLDVPDAHVRRLHDPLYNASIMRLLTNEKAISLSGFNDISHLSDKMGGPLLVTYR